MELPDFLLTCIAEDETQRVTRFRGGPSPTPRELREAARWEAECDAKRRIIGALTYEKEARVMVRQGVFEYRPVKTLLIGIDEAGDVLRAMALPYADHPDYDPRWTP